ncbi:MAG: hypothetical protein ACR2P1_07350 [Pseudomonadales bacterium]
MEATRRQHYLSAIGIDCWLPRQQLPGAAPGSVYVRKLTEQAAALPETPASQTGRDSNTNDTDAARSSAARLQQEFTGAVPAKTTSGRIPQQPQTAAQADATSFQLAFYAWAPELLVVDQVQDARMQQQLISNLLFALGHSSLQRTQPDYFDWPIRGGRQALALSPHEMVFGVLQRVLEQHKPRNMLLMGELAVKHVLATKDKDFVAGVSPDSSPLYLGVSIVTTHASAELLHNPQLKAETWQHLQSLRL